MKLCSRCHVVPAPGYCRACMRAYLVERGDVDPPMLTRCQSCDGPVISTGGRRRFCSQDCARGQVRRPREQQYGCGTAAAYRRGCRCEACRDAKAAADNGRPLNRCADCGRVARAERCVDCLPAGPSRLCPDCGAERPRGRRRCGDCAERANAEAVRRARRAYRHRRRAARRGVSADYFTDVEIFERDGWRCHICRKAVRRAPRSRMDPDRATLDHIWPLSKGGEHSRENVACAHLRCNLAKGARVSPTQMMLVG